MTTSGKFTAARRWGGAMAALAAVAFSAPPAGAAPRATPADSRQMAGGRVLGLDDICGTDCRLQVFARCDGLLEGPSAGPDGAVWLTSPSAGRIYRLGADGRCETVIDNPMPNFRPAGTQLDKDGRLVGTLVLTNDLYALDAATRKLIVIQDKPIANDPPPPATARGDGYSGFNDLTFDATGGAYITDMRASSVLRPTGRIVYRAADGTRSVVVPSGLALPDGIALSPDGRTLYFNEWLGNRIIAVPVVSPGVLKLGLASVFAYLAGTKGPDGMRVDAAGNLYVAHQGAGGEIAVYAPDGSYRGAIRLAEGRDFSPTHLAFVGDYLYVTEGKEAVTGPQPGNAVWRVRIRTGASKPAVQR